MRGGFRGEGGDIVGAGVLTEARVLAAKKVSQVRVGDRLHRDTLHLPRLGSQPDRHAQRVAARQGQGLGTLRRIPGPLRAQPEPGEREMGGGTRWGPRSPLGDVSIESHVPQGKLRAVEVYRNPSNAPPEYQRSFMDCGVVLIWTDYGFGFEVPSARGAGVQDSGAESSTLAAP